MRRTIPNGFTLPEMVVSMSILILIVLLVSRLFSSATTVTTAGNKRMNANAHARPVIDRMIIDFAQMLKRADVDYYLKRPGVTQTGNDQIAFFSTVAGYYPSTGSQSTVSLVGYRVSSTNQLERMGKGLVWNGVSPSDVPLVFLPITINTTWPTATNASADSDYEPAGSQVFRFEYQYLLRSGTLTDTPWDAGAGHTAVAGLQDVAAISVLIASLDPQSRTLLSTTQLSTLGTRLQDFSNGMRAGDLAGRWQTSIDGITDMPRPALAAVRINERYLYLSR